MSNTNFKVLASAGNQALYPSGQPLFATAVPENPLVPPRPLQKAGQLSFFDPIKGESVGSGDVAAMNEIGIALGIGPRIGGPATELRMVIYDALHIEGIEYLSVEGPRCASSPSGRLLINCVQCDEPVMVNIRYRNSNTESSKDMGQWNTITLDAKKVCNSCGDCTAEDVSAAVACALADNLRLKKPNYSQPAGNFSAMSPLVEEVVRITAITADQKGYDFCLNPITNACGECIKLTAIIGVKWATVGEDSDVITYFEYTVDPDDTTKTFTDQVDSIIDQINADMLTKGLRGRAYRASTGNANTCCPIKIRIISCTDVVLLTGEEGDTDDVDPCNEPASILTPITINSDCVDCGDSGSSSKTFSAGIELSFILPDTKLGCVPDSNGISWYGIDYDIEVIGVPDGEWMWIEDNELVLPANTGYQWMQIELQQEVGGVGRNQDYYHLTKGYYGELTDSSRAKNLTVQGTKSYCAFTLGGGTIRQTFVSNGAFFKGKWEQHILIPSADSNTSTPFQTMLNAIAQRGKFVIKGANNCKSGDDVIAKTYLTAVTGMQKD